MATLTAQQHPHHEPVLCYHRPSPSKREWTPYLFDKGNPLLTIARSLLPSPGLASYPFVRPGRQPPPPPPPLLILPETNVPALIRRATASAVLDLARHRPPTSPTLSSVLLSPTLSLSPSLASSATTSYSIARGPSSSGSAGGGGSGGPSSGSDGALSVYEIQRAELRPVVTGPHSRAATPVLVAISPSPSSTGIRTLGAVIEPLIPLATTISPRMIASASNDDDDVAPAVPRPKKSGSKGKARGSDGAARRDTLLAAKKRRRASTVAVSLSAELLEDNVFPGGQLPDAQSIASFAYYGQRSTKSTEAKRTTPPPPPPRPAEGATVLPARSRQSRSSFSLNLLAKLNPIARLNAAAPPLPTELPTPSPSPVPSMPSSTEDSAEYRSHPWNAAAAAAGPSRSAAVKSRSAGSHAVVAVVDGASSSHARSLTTRRRPSSTASMTPYLRSTSPSSRGSIASSRSARSDEVRMTAQATGSAGARKSPIEREPAPPVPPLPAALLPARFPSRPGPQRFQVATDPDDGAESDDYDVLDITHAHPPVPPAVGPTTTATAVPEAACCASCSGPLSRGPSSELSDAASAVNSPDYTVEIDLPPAGLGIPDLFLDELDVQSSQWNLAALAAELDLAEQESGGEYDDVGDVRRALDNPTEEAPAFGHEFGSSSGSRGGGDDDDDDDGESDCSLNPSPRTPSLSGFAGFDGPVAVTPVLGLIVETEEREDDSPGFSAWSAGLLPAAVAVPKSNPAKGETSSSSSSPSWSTEQTRTDLSAVNLASPSARRRSRRVAGLSPTSTSFPPVFPPVVAPVTPRTQPVDIDGLSPPSTAVLPALPASSSPSALYTPGLAALHEPSPSSTAAIDLFGRLLMAATSEEDELPLAEAVRRASVNTFGQRRPSEAVLLGGEDGEVELESASFTSLPHLAQGACGRADPTLFPLRSLNLL